MQIIPTINCQDFNCVKDKLQKAAEFGVDWIQIDIADGKFTKHKAWNNQQQISNLNQIQVINY